MKSTSFSRQEVFFLLSALFVVIFIWLASPFIVSVLSGLTECSLEQRGQFGDSYAVTNTLFSALAFVALIAALLFQRKDLMGQVQQLSEQVLQFEQQNHLSSQQIAFQEIQARIDSMPFIRADLRLENTNPFGGTDLQWSCFLTNEGPPIYNVRVHFCGQHETYAWVMKMNPGQKLNCYQPIDPQISPTPISWKVLLVNKLGEQLTFTAEMPDPSSEHTKLTEFDVEAQKIREDVLGRLRTKIKDPRE